MPGYLAEAAAVCAEVTAALAGTGVLAKPISAGLASTAGSVSNLR